MAFTDHSDLFGSVHEDGFNRVIRHIMRQRPSLFNYATLAFRENPELFCERIEAASTVLEAGNPLFTEQEPIPIFGTPVPLGLNFCLQLTDFEIDFHPTTVFELPEELGGKLKEQRFALRVRACAGIDCPDDELVDQIVGIIERLVVAQRRESQIKERRDRLSSAQFASMQASTASTTANLQANRPAGTLSSSSTSAETKQSGGCGCGEPKQETAEARPSTAELSEAARSMPMSSMLSSFSMFSQPTFASMSTGTAGMSTRATMSEFNQRVIPLPTRKLLCFCLELYVVGHFEWGTVGGTKQQWFKPRVDGIEIVDIAPTPMENALECYAMTVLRLGIMPRLMLPMEKMILDITKVMQDQGISIGKQVDLGPSVVPTDVPNNPAIEDDQVKVFIKLTVTP